MTLEGEEYSSILCFFGTNLGRLFTFKLLPSSNGTYSVQSAGTANLDDRIVSISPFNADTGKPAYASQVAVAGLREGKKVNGVLLVTTETGARIFKPYNE